MMQGAAGDSGAVAATGAAAFGLACACAVEGVFKKRHTANTHSMNK
jgi:hypothetical protein